MLRLLAIAGLILVFVFGTGAHQSMDALHGAGGPMMASMQIAAAQDGDHHTNRSHAMLPCHGASCSQPFVMGFSRIAVRPKLPSRTGTFPTRAAPPFVRSIEPPVPRLLA